jgi:hypothetical protein
MFLHPLYYGEHARKVSGDYVVRIGGAKKLVWPSNVSSARK